VLKKHSVEDTHHRYAEAVNEEGECHEDEFQNYIGPSSA
jgi:hypothetical protein